VSDQDRVWLDLCLSTLINAIEHLTPAGIDPVRHGWFYALRRDARECRSILNDRPDPEVPA